MDYDAEQLISLVKKYPVLFKIDHPDYTCAKLKNEIWEKIGIELELEGVIVKDEWMRLRDNHREALRRQRIRGQKTKPIKPWIYQKQMEFLEPYMKTRSTISTVDPLSLLESCGSIIIKSDPGESSEEAEDSTSEPPTKKVNTSSESSIRNFMSKCEQGLASETEEDALHSFFIAMYKTTRELPMAYQRSIRKKLFDIVTQAEEECESKNQKFLLNM